MCIYIYIYTYIYYIICYIYIYVYIYIYIVFKRYQCGTCRQKKHGTGEDQQYSALLVETETINLLLAVFYDDSGELINGKFI